MKIRVGMEGGRLPVLKRAAELNAAILVSANSLWDNKRKHFRGWKVYAGHDVALDSGGFVAMKLYGGYRFTVPQYVALAREMRPTWYAQTDFCCEPEIATDRASVRDRIAMTVSGLNECRTVAAGEGVPMPMPVLQGWTPDDYCQGPIYENAFPWPDLVGVGSVCRRDINGPNGLLAVIEAMNKAVPSHVRFHLFGVKSQAISEVERLFPGRCASMDSMAWNVTARKEARSKRIPSTGAQRAEVMARWYLRQCERIDSDPQLKLF